MPFSIKLIQIYNVGIYKKIYIYLSIGTKVRLGSFKYL